MAIPVTLDNTIGIAFLGLSASCLLIGISIVQTHLYYHNYPKDWMFQKVAVRIVAKLTRKENPNIITPSSTLAALHTVFTIHAMYFYLIDNFGNPKASNRRLTLMVIMVQTLYGLRVWKLGKHFSRFWPAVVVVVVAGGWVAMIDAFGQKDFSNLDSMKKIIYATFATATGIDFVIAIAMCYYLNRSRTSFAGTNNKIFIVMRYVLITGFLTSACSLSTLITYATMPDNLVFIGIDLLLPNLYANSYIAMLNARKSMNESETSGSDVSKALNIRAGTTVRTDFGNLHSMDDKMSPVRSMMDFLREANSLEAEKGTAKFTSSAFSNAYDLEREIPPKHVEISVHRTEGRE
ncbi:hypothetical protein M413DRAFT_447869 [Hebeloma cylindrosporum]|uniref:DUF6534 domain-containing protein n=1 Tax=Hebeloma cylindrosporum TaxID=76867 RepID=A0A0C2XKX3_HEBCY|nr:hypothetical protein M413DRAFT_447869 [Hebeloma cylindrosporum h7]